MTVRVRKVVVVDGAEISIEAEGGSAKEALAAVEHEAEELGAAPSNGAVAGSRKRRTKAELEAAKTAADSPAPYSGPPDQPAMALPPLPQGGGAPFAGPTINHPPGQVVTEGGEAVRFSSDPPAPPSEGKSVAFAGPPPSVGASLPPPPAFQPPSEEQDLRAKIDAAVERTIALRPEWRDAVLGNLANAVRPHGGSLSTMSSDVLRAVLRDVEAYEARVVEATRR